MATNNRASDTPAPVVSPPRQGSEFFRVANLAIGDLLAFLIFTVIGMNSHSEGINLSRVLLTVWPFLVGWYIVAPFLGAYRRDVTTQTRKMSLRTFLAWIPAWAIAMVLRGISTDHGVPPPTFMLIAFLVNAFFLQLWRVPYAWSKSMKR